MNTHHQRGAVNLGGLVTIVVVFVAGAYLAIHIAIAIIGWRAVVAILALALFAALLSLAYEREARP